MNFCKNVNVILDYHSSFINLIKQDFSPKRKDEFNLVWEGLPENICFNEFANEVVEFINSYNADLSNKIKIKLNVFTDLYFKKYMNRFFLQNSFYNLKKKTDHIYFHEWNIENINKNIIENDLAIIPLSQSNPLEAGKPANKLFLFFKMGMPTITSNTFAYSEVENNFKIKFTFKNINEFAKLLNIYMERIEIRKEYSENAINFINTELPESKLSNLWSGIFK